MGGLTVGLVKLVVGCCAVLGAADVRLPLGVFWLGVWLIVGVVWLQS